MITNDRQYKISIKQLLRFKEALSSFDTLKFLEKGIDPLIIEAQKNSYTEQISELEQDIAAYKKLVSGTEHLTALSVGDLGIMLVKARIASGLSQKALADRLGMKEQQLQRYEQDRYSSTSLKRLEEVANALQLSVSSSMTLKSLPVVPYSLSEEAFSLDMEKLPLDIMRQRGWLGWFAKQQDDFQRTEKELAAAFISQNFKSNEMRTFNRQNVRAKTSQDEYALIAWKARVLFLAKEKENKWK